MKAIIIPGNDYTLITSNWYQYVKNELEKLGLEVIAENMGITEENLEAQIKLEIRRKEYPKKHTRINVLKKK